MPKRIGQQYICGQRALVPNSLVGTALTMANAKSSSKYTAEDVQGFLVCTIRHRGPVHYGVLLNLRGVTAGTLWALWRDRVEPVSVLELPDCSAVHSDDDAACSEFEGHPGGHSWELSELPSPLRPATRLPRWP